MKLVLNIEIVEYRKDCRPVFYMDETYVHSTHKTPKAWSDSKANGSRLKTLASNDEHIFSILLTYYLPRLLLPPECA